MNKPVFSENVVVLTGASAGIGKELAMQLARQGACLSLAARHADRLEEVGEQCRQLGAKAITVPTDVADKKQCEQLIERTVQEYGRIDTLVNNAGITMWALFEDIEDLSLLENIMQVNFFGSVYCTYYALPYIKKNKGRIVGVASLTGKTGVPTRSGYAASKHAMAGFFDSLRIELSGSGVSVTMVFPGFVATDIRERAIDGKGNPLEKSPLPEEEMMPVEKCANIIVEAMENRKREVVMTTRGKIGVWLKLIAPALVDKIARRAIEKG
ncbi:MAG TPA: SDR family oxidoreductase [Caldithrix abyssi]|uniref:SDR family oxidoreductase n=1 Tax=Caldithrix abyssi TaxID=187145 RepID=A0A7V4WVD9_CALAY|nr:SDR family oxidoreductase [Caldithrix abyssi]